MFQINVIPTVTSFSMDFEIAAHNAALTVFPNRAINGCFYHLCQSTYRKIQELGLAVRYNQDAVFKNFCGTLDALAFLRLVDVPFGMNIIRNTAIVNQDPAPVMASVDYFDATYVNAGIGNQGAMFPPRGKSLKKVTYTFLSKEKSKSQKKSQKVKKKSKVKKKVKKSKKKSKVKKKSESKKKVKKSKKKVTKKKVTYTFFRVIYPSVSPCKMECSHISTE